MAKRLLKNKEDLAKYIKGKTLETYKGNGPAYRPLEFEKDFSDPTVPTFLLPIDERIKNVFPKQNKAERIVIHATGATLPIGNKNTLVLYMCSATSTPLVEGKKGTQVRGTTRPRSEQDGTKDWENWNIYGRWFQGNYRNALGHYNVYLDGEVDQLAPEDCKIAHAGGAPKGWYNGNSVGIEFHFPYKQRDPNLEPWPTEIMYKNGAKLVKDICRRRNIPIDREHITYHKPNPGDPGVFWNWDYFMSLLKEEEVGPLPAVATAAPNAPAASTPSSTPTVAAPATTKTENDNRAKQSTAAPPASQPNKTEKEEQKKESKTKEIVPLTDEEIKASLIGYYMPYLIKNRVNNTCDSFVHLNTDSTTSFIRNLLFTKGKDKYNDFSLLSSLDLSMLVPFVEIYKVDKESNGYQKHTLYPFDDYIAKTKFDLMFADKTGRGGAVGIEDLQWETVATNPSNVSQVLVSIKIRIQDIQEIESIRNGISLLDFLYPGGSSNRTNHSPNTFNIKLKVGWLYKRQENNKDLLDLDQKIGQEMLSETILATLHKHSFDFAIDGSVLLNLQYYGMLETQISDPYKFDVLKKLNPKLNLAQQRKNAADFLKEAVNDKKWNSSTFTIIKSDPVKFDSIKVKAVEQKISAFEKKSIIVYGEEGKQIVVGDSKWDHQEKKWVENIDKDEVTHGYIYDSDFVNYLDKVIPETEEEFEASFLDGIANLIESLSIDNKINWIKIKKNQVDLLRQISEMTKREEIIKSGDYKNLSGKGGFLEKTKLESSGQVENDGRATELLNTRELGYGEKTENFFASAGNMLGGDFEGATSGKALKRSGAKITIDTEVFEKELLRGVTEEGEEGDLAISYVYLGDILDYYMKLFFPEKDASNNHEMRLVIGTFSYRDIGELTEDSSQTGQTRKTQVKGLKTKDGTPYKTISAAKKYANISDIPISMESLLNWYNNHVLDSSLDRMSFNKFIRSLFSNVIPANLSNQILSYGPKRTLLPGFNYITTSRDESNELEIRKFAKEKDPEKPSPEPKYKILMEAENYKNSSFNRLRDRAEIKKIDKEFVPVTNYLFITSLSERNKQMIADYKQDLEKGIYHFYVGEDKGLVKEIKFEREDNEKLDAANLVKANKNNLDNQIIRQIYNAKINLFGNTIFYPGQLIHVTPTYPGTKLKSSTLYQIGLGGYFQIMKVVNEIDDGEFETVLHTKWVTDGQGLEGKEYFLKVEKQGSDGQKNTITEGKA